MSRFLLNYSGFGNAHCSPKEQLVSIVDHEIGTIEKITARVVSGYHEYYNTPLYTDRILYYRFNYQEENCPWKYKSFIFIPSCVIFDRDIWDQLVVDHPVDFKEKNNHLWNDVDLEIINNLIQLKNKLRIDRLARFDGRDIVDLTTDDFWGKNIKGVECFFIGGSTYRSTLHRMKTQIDKEYLRLREISAETRFPCLSAKEEAELFSGSSSL
tara:strand:+ start:63 stop:698 length:636 start_codon:yes stop_codon:yes gene_type:complete